MTEEAGLLTWEWRSTRNTSHSEYCKAHLSASGQPLSGGDTHCAGDVILAALSFVAVVPTLQGNVLAPSLFFPVEAVAPSLRKMGQTYDRRPIA